MKISRIQSDGTAYGTKVLDEDGELIKGVVAVQRQGRKLFVTTRHDARNTEVLGLEGDFHLAVSRKFQPALPPLTDAEVEAMLAELP